jgi:hypothetical protein
MDHRPPSAPARTSPHSIRCEDAVWKKAAERAKSEGITTNHVLSELLEGYAEGKINMPTIEVVKDYSQVMPSGRTS